MPFAALHRNDPIPALDPIAGLSFRREQDAAVMAAVQGRDVSEMTRRFAAGHRAFVASLHGESAAWGWVATRTADIGELGTTFTVPCGERYLWNFVTRPSHRGMGIYPRLLEAIVRAESREADRFWVAYAPENHASGAGIAKAGFVSLAELSFDAQGKAGLTDVIRGGAKVVSRVIGVPVADALAPCWRCVRAGRVSMSCPPERCQCDYQRPTSGCAA